MNENRIGAACWYKRNGKSRGGKLRMWAVEGSLDDGIAPVAVIEDEITLQVTTSHVTDVSFATIPPWPVDHSSSM